MRALLTKPAFALSRILSRSYYVTQLARKVVQIYDNDCNGDMNTNGEARLQRVIASLTTSESVVMDVGANVGEWSAAWIATGAKGRLVAIDPLRRNLDAVQGKLERLGCQRFDLCEVALSDGAGKVKFFTHSDPSLSGHDSMLDMRSIGYDESVESTEVNTDTLDRLASKLGISNILLLKVDVEGNELAVLKGARQLMAREAIEFIQIEFGHAARAARVYLYDIVTYVGQHAYDMFVIKPNGLAPLNFSPFTENQYSYINLLIARRASLHRLGANIMKR
jgi:FkbM family methyltransferase